MLPHIVENRNFDRAPRYAARCKYLFRLTFHIIIGLYHLVKHNLKFFGKIYMKDAFWRQIDVTQFIPDLRAKFREL